ncbi:Fungalysin metallopeptidase-domain-containing protein [Crassisporium funariophilum]|nr:Fungalysin metallopeptidase-domain-containing protein [Crassisporium funariophilum]
MVAFNKVFKSVFFAIVYSSIALAAPSADGELHTGSFLRVRDFGNGLKLEAYHPEPSFETFDEPLDHALSARQDFDLQHSTTRFLASHFGIDENKITYTSGFHGEVARHAYVKQTHDGVPYANAVANIAYNHDNKVVSVGSSFVDPANTPSSIPSFALESAITKAESLLGATHVQEHTPTLEYLVRKNGAIILSHVMQVRNLNEGIWVEAYVDAHSGDLVSVVDFSADAAYFALPLHKQDPTKGFELIEDPADMEASPMGWHDDNKTTTRTTAGNNAISFKGDDTNQTTHQSSGNLTFDFPWESKRAPNITDNVNLARVNTFYVVNSVHDFAYRYGFTEKSFNFQTDNFKKGGKSNDTVLISVQDASGMNNAQFYTPPDGQHGVMRMFLFDQSTPWRDGALENDIVTHENTHGITNRLTGGGTGRCLQSVEAAGLGEGWSDAMADWTEKNSSEVRDLRLGGWVQNDPAGIRTYPYSTSRETNPLLYSSVKTLESVHDIGEVWANILHNQYAALVSSNGWSSTARHDPTGPQGNVVWLHIFIDALSLQPCNPTFLHARDAWIQADKMRYGGANKCVLWKVFASRGLGVDAAKFKDSFSVPEGC